MANTGRPLFPPSPTYPMAPPGTPGSYPTTPLNPNGPPGPTYSPQPPPLPPQPPAVTEVTWLRIISQQLGQVIGLMGGKGKGGGGGPPSGGGGRQGGALTKLGNFWSNISNFVGGFSGVGRGIGSGRLGQAAYGLTRAGQAMDHLKEMFGGASGAGSAAGRAAGAGGRALGAAAGAVGAVGTVAGAAIAYAAFLHQMKVAADELVQFNANLAKVSASMGLVYAQREYQELMRERQKGDALANSGGLLVRGEQRYKDAIAPWETAWGELKNNFLAGFYTQLADILATANGIADTLGISVKKQADGAASKSFSDLVNKVADDAKRKQEEARRRAVGGK